MRKRSRFIKKVITYIGSFVSALSVIASFFPSAFSFLSGVPNADQLVLLFVVAILLGLFFLNSKQTADDNEYKLEVEHKSTHRYAHLLRNTMYEIKKLNPNGDNDALAMHIMTSFAKDTLDCLKDSLEALADADPTKEELMVSVKILDLEYWNNLSIQDKTAVTYRTLSRSVTPKGALQADDAKSHKITENTALYRVFVEGKHDWSGINLDSKKNIQIISEDEIQVGAAYCDTCVNWQDHYRHNMVVPIRVKMSEIDSKYMNSDERNLLGFLCVEYKRNDLFRFSGKDDAFLISICDYLKTYADTMYIVFDSIYKTMRISKQGR